MSKPAGPTHFEIPCGTRWEVTLTWWLDSTKTTAKNLTSYTARMDIRRSIGDADSDRIASLTSAGGDITLGGTAGTIAIVYDDSATGAVTPGLAVFDIELTDPSSNVVRLLYGTVEFTEQVTR